MRSKFLLKAHTCKHTHKLVGGKKSSNCSLYLQFLSFQLELQEAETTPLPWQGLLPHSSQSNCTPVPQCLWAVCYGNARDALSLKKILQRKVPAFPVCQKLLLQHFYIAHNRSMKLNSKQSQEIPGLARHQCSKQSCLPGIHTLV